MKYIKTYENWDKKWTQKNLKVGDYVKYGTSIYLITKYDPDDMIPYWVENVLKNNDKYWSTLGDNYSKLTPKQAEIELLKHKYNI